MRVIKINGVPYTVKFSYRAAKYEDCVQKAFAILSGSVILSDATDSENPKFSDIIKGSIKQVGMIPQACDTFFFAGLIEDKNENKPKTEEEAGDLLIDYMEANNKTYDDVFDSLMECMKEDGFFEKAGITQMLERMFEKKDDQAEVEKPGAEETKVTPIKKTTTKKKATTTTK